MIHLFKHMRTRERVLVLISILFIIVQVQLDLAMPDYMSEITVLVQTEGSEMSEILSAGGKMLLCALGSLFSAVVVGFFAAWISANFSKNLREGIYDKVMSYSDEEINRFSTASLINRTTNDVTQIQMIVAMGLQMLIKAPITAVMAIGKISTKNIQWTTLTIAVVLLIVCIQIGVIVFAVPRFKKVQWMTDDLNRVTRENLNGIMVVRAYNAEDYQKNKFEETNRKLTKTNLETHLIMSVMNPGINLGMNILTLGIYWIGASLINGVVLTGAESIAERLGLFSDMVVFSSYSMQIVMSFLMLVMIFIMLPRAMVSAKRINEVLDEKVRMQDGMAAEGTEGQRGKVEFRNVSFCYPGGGNEVLHHISFTADQGDTVALIGATGSGKSTIVNLIPRMYDATEGQVLIDGVDVKTYSQKALHRKIGFVPQKAFLFSGTIESNVGYGLEKAERERIGDAVSIAQAQEFVKGNYQTEVAQEGSNFSGGQKQRLSIARAIAKKPEILVFDDSFSALDYKTDRTLRSAIRQKMAGTTNIIVAQRIGTIKDADRILVIDEGRIVGDGTHEELMQSCGLYREIAYSQMSKEELGA